MSNRNPPVYWLSSLHPQDEISKLLSDIPDAALLSGIERNWDIIDRWNCEPNEADIALAVEANTALIGEAVRRDLVSVTQLKIIRTMHAPDDVACGYAEGQLFRIHCGRPEPI